MKTNFTPSPALDGKFKVVNTDLPILLNTKIGDIDLRTISLEDAERLYKLDSYYLQKLPEKKVIANTKKNSPTR